MQTDQQTDQQDRVDIEELKRLHNQSTQGEWRFSTTPQPNGCPIIGNGKGLMVAMLAHSVNERGQKDEALANAGFIVESFNAFPSMAAELEQSRVKAEKWDRHERKKCEYCGSSEHLHTASMPCPGCGAPQCCTLCCKMENLKQECDSLRQQVASLSDELAALKEVYSHVVTSNKALTSANKRMEDDLTSACSINSGLRVENLTLQDEFMECRTFTSFEHSIPSLNRPLLVTNNLTATNAHGEMSHLWLVPIVHKAEDGTWTAFDDGNRRIERLTHWRYAVPALTPSDQKPSQPQDARNWTEDYSHENGNYNNVCHTCKQVFVGHKRRPLCKVCASQPHIPDAGEMVEAKRADFEEWASEARGMNVDRDHDGDYVEDETFDAWLIWEQALSTTGEREETHHCEFCGSPLPLGVRNECVGACPANQNGGESNE